MLSREYMYKTTSIPVEIWHKSWSYCHRAELRILSRTCRLFHEICLPMLFGNLTTRNLYELEEGHWVGWNLCSLSMLLSSMAIEGLAGSPKHATLLRRWELSTIEPSTLSGFETMSRIASASYKLLKVSHLLYLNSVSRNLPAFAGLRALEISNFKIGEDIFNALKGLPALKILICLWTTFAFPCYSTTLLLPLRKFRLDTHKAILAPNATAFDIISNNFLETLDISSPLLSLIFTSLSNQGPCENLSDLQLDNDDFDIPSLFNFLTFCPRLRNLSLANYHRLNPQDPNDLGIPPLPNSVIPHLRSFSGYGYLAKLIIPGRPVEIVSILGQLPMDFNTTTILKSISQSTLPIHDLSLSLLFIDLETIPSIHPHLPTELKHLHLNFYVAPEDIPPALTSSSIPAQPADTTQDNVMSTVPEVDTYAQLLRVLSNDKYLPYGLQALEVVNLYSIEILDELKWPDSQYHDYLAKLSILYPLVTVVVMGGYDHYRSGWVKNRDDGHWENVSRDDTRLSHFIRDDELEFKS